MKYDTISASRCRVPRFTYYPNLFHSHCAATAFTLFYFLFLLQLSVQVVTMQLEHLRCTHFMRGERGSWEVGFLGYLPVYSIYCESMHRTFMRPSMSDGTNTFAGNGTKSPFTKGDGISGNVNALQILSNAPVALRPTPHIHPSHSGFFFQLAHST